MNGPVIVMDYGAVSSRCLDEVCKFEQALNNWNIDRPAAKSRIKMMIKMMMMRNIKKEKKARASLLYC